MFELSNLRFVHLHRAQLDRLVVGNATDNVDGFFAILLAAFRKQVKGLLGCSDRFVSIVEDAVPTS